MEEDLHLPAFATLALQSLSSSQTLAFWTQPPALVGRWSSQNLGSWPVSTLAITSLFYVGKTMRGVGMQCLTVAENAGKQSMATIPALTRLRQEDGMWDQLVLPSKILSLNSNPIDKKTTQGFLNQSLAKYGHARLHTVTRSGSQVSPLPMETVCLGGICREALCWWEQCLRLMFNGSFFFWWGEAPAFS